MIPALNVTKLRLDMGDYVLSVASLSKRIGASNLLDGVDLDVKRGGFTTLVGPAGAGKSLTLACIAGAVKPSRGRVRYFGYEIGGRGETRVTQMGVGRTHQPPQMFAGLSVLDSVTIGALLRRPRLARAQAHAREISTLVDLEPWNSTPVEALDAGQRQRLAIARVLATDPQLLLLDDVCAGLDAEAIAKIVAVLGAVRLRGMTVVAATRARDQFVSLADEVVEIDSGITVRIRAHVAATLRA